ncbi:MAG: hypothetical protein EOO61_15200 [Hymenobacter sp.]|nr:MAG: hypothetical protein EOO61_15200 [Hymenobacter sp.]
MSAKDMLKLLAIAAVFFALAPYLLNGINRLRYPSTVNISYLTAIQGHVTGSRTNRQYTLIYLDGSENKYYDFNSFLPDSISTPLDSLSQEDKNRLTLGAHLRKGDCIIKAAHSNQLTVQRGGTDTHWSCSIDTVAE